MNRTEQQKNLYGIGAVCFKLGCIGFGGAAGMVGLMESELVTKKKWVTREHYLDVVGTANIIPGPNSVEIIMHCARAKGGRAGLITAGIMYILPSMIICMIWAGLYNKYGQLPSVAPFLYGIAPATTAIVVNAVFRLSKGLFKKIHIAILAALVLIGSLFGLNDVALLFAAGIFGALFINRKTLFSIVPLPLLFIENSTGKLFLIFLKIGAILYGSGYVLFAYMDDALVQNNHWLTKQQLVDAIAVGQVTPGPILSSATFAGYIINGPVGAVTATVAIFLPSFVISLFLYRLLDFINRHRLLRSFLDIVNAASVALIAAVAIQMVAGFVKEWQADVILLLALCAVLLTRINSIWIIVLGGCLGYVLKLL